MSKQYPLFFVLTLLLLSAATAGCRQTAANLEVNAQATIDTAVAATDAAQVSTQATIDAAVAATTAAQPPSPEATSVDPPATAVAQADGDAVVPSVPAEEMVTLSEEELAALIDEALTAATIAAQQSAAAAADAAADSTMTEAEIQTVEIYLNGSAETIAYVEQAIETYAALYGELAVEAVEELEAIEDSLDAIEASTAALSDSLDEVDEAIEQGVALAEETITQVEAAAQTAGQQAAALQDEAQSWVTDHQASLDNRIATAVAISADQVVSDPKAAIEQALTFFDTGQSALGDGQISAAELSDIAQQGANASAGLDASGLLPLQALSDQIDQVTTQFARGDISQARSYLDGLSASLDAVPEIEGLSFEKPSLPEREGITVPEKPERPSR